MAIKTIPTGRMNTKTLFRNLKKAQKINEEIAKYGENRKVNIWYPLIPTNPVDGKIFAYAHIKWDSEQRRLVYNLVEPKTTGLDKEIIESVVNNITQVNKNDLRYRKLVREEIRGLLKNILSEKKRNVLGYYAEKEVLGLGEIEPLVRDPFIRSISCTGHSTPLQIEHETLGSLQTNLNFNTTELERFVSNFSEKLGYKNEAEIDTYLDDGSKIHININNETTRHGSNFIINRTAGSFNLIQSDIDIRHLAYLWDAIENHKKIIISGPHSSGKTSLLNTLSLFIHPNDKVVSIEAMPQISIPHNNWISVIGNLSDSVLKHRPDYIISDDAKDIGMYLNSGFPVMVSSATSIGQLDAIKQADAIVELSRTRKISKISEIREGISVSVFDLEDENMDPISKQLLVKEDILKSIAKSNNKDILDSITKYYLK